MAWRSHDDNDDNNKHFCDSHIPIRKIINMYEHVDPNKSAEESVEKIKTDDQGRLIVGAHKSVKIDHAGAANILIKHINVVPNLSTESRLIMSMKVMNPGLKNRVIATEMKITEYDVHMYEQEGINKCAEHLNKMKLEESVKKFNMDNINEQQIKNLNRDKSNPLITGVDQNN